MTIRHLTFVLLVLSVFSANSASAGDNDLIIMMALDAERPLTGPEIIGQLDDAIDNQKVEGISAVAVPRRLYNRFARIIGAPERKLDRTGSIIEVDGALHKWHIRGYGTEPDTPDFAPDRLVLKMREFKPDGTSEEVVREFPVDNVASTDTESVAQALEGEDKKILVRSNDFWEVLGYRLEWGGSDNGVQRPVKNDQGENTFEEWTQEPPCFLIVIPDFDQYNVPVELVYNKLRENSERLIVQKPKRPLKLVALDIEPIGRGISELSFETYFTLRVPAAGNEKLKLAPHVWALFPLTKAQRDEHIEKIHQVEMESAGKIGAGGRYVPEYILGFKDGGQQGPAYNASTVPIEDAVAGLTERNLPQPTAILDPEFQAVWHEVPAVTGEDGNVKYFARTLRVDSVVGEFPEDVAWAVVSYARPSNPDAAKTEWRAGKVNSGASGKQPEYAVAFENPIPKFISSLIRSGVLDDAESRELDESGEETK